MPSAAQRCDLPLWRARVREMAAGLENSSIPAIAWIRQTFCSTNPSPLGVFSASFNPLTRAHEELIASARRQFSLRQILLLLGLTNAEKRAYEASLEDRALMLLLAFETDPEISIGLSSHPFFADMLVALRREAAGAEIWFLVGSDIFELILDREGRYLGRYFTPYPDRMAVLEDLFSTSHLIVATRSRFTCRDLDRVIEEEIPRFRARIHCLEMPESVREISATEVRRRVRAGEPIADLVPQAVARYIHQTGLYR